MDPVTLVIVPGFIGGVVIALVFLKANRHSMRGESDPFADRALSTDVINMAHIRVAGIGGLGFVAMAVVVALYVPRIGQSLAVGLLLGFVFAAVLVARRRRAGPLPSSARRMGANTSLSLDEPVPPENSNARHAPS